MSERFFFSLEGVDINDEDALEAFTTQVWNHVTDAWGNPDDDGRLETDE